MKVDISIEFDKELATAIMDTVREISKGMKSLQEIFDKSDLSVSTENVSEPTPEETKPVVKRKPRAKKTLRGTVLKVIKKNKDGISRKALLEKTGFSSRQVIDCVYQMRKNQTIELTEDGLLKIL